MNTIMIDNEGGGDYPPDLYRGDHRGRYLETVDQLTEADIASFRRDGYLAIRRVLDPADIPPIIDGFAAVLDHPQQAVIQYESWATDIETATPAQRMDMIRKFMWFSADDDRLAAIVRDQRILSVVRRLCGDDLAMIQDMALLKPPGRGREKPWHQDNAFLRYEPGTRIVGVWIALDEATTANGCMHIIPGSHRRGPVPHFRRRDFQLCDTDVDRPRDTVMPLPPGGALFFDGLLHHGTPANRTNTRRRALQLHYIPADTPTIPDERRLEIFGGEGRHATC